MNLFVMLDSQIQFVPNRVAEPEQPVADPEGSPQEGEAVHVPVVPRWPPHCFNKNKLIEPAFQQKLKNRTTFNKQKNGPN